MVLSTEQVQLSTYKEFRDNSKRRYDVLATVDDDPDSEVIRDRVMDAIQEMLRLDVI